MRFDVIVVGSGFGGAVMAARLAERGLQVLVLERGPWWGPGGADQPPADRRELPRGGWGTRKLLRNVRWARGGGRSRDLVLHRDGLWEWHAFDGLHVFTASGVGGGSLVYTNIQEQPEDDFFAALPPELSADELRPYYGRVREVLRPTPSPHPPQKAEALAHAVAVAGLGIAEHPDLAVAWGRDPHVPEAVTNAAGIRQSTCVNVGNCVLGCEYRAKTTLDLTYVPLALRRGARLRPLSEVVAVGRARSGYRVRWVDHRTGQLLEREAPRLVLAAGTLNTLRLLFLARRLGSLPGLPPSLGRNFSGNGDAVSLLYRTRLRTRSDEGPAINAFLRVRDGSGRHRHAVGEAGLPLNALPLPGWLHRRLRRSAVLFAYGRERSHASLRFDGRGLRTSAGRRDDPELYAEIEVTMQRIAAAYGARKQRIGWPGGPGRGPLVSVHPVGGASIGRTAEEGLVDHTGGVFGCPGLYIADGSLYPCAPGIPPAMTIAALAEREAHLLD